ncbi:non-ribosomal peptide synthetase [Brenneria goodwinii]|nr:non-ribosomal peptide synthetase [Brenneria goodwinii]
MAGTTFLIILRRQIFLPKILKCCAVNIITIKNTLSLNIKRIYPSSSATKNGDFMYSENIYSVSRSQEEVYLALAKIPHSSFYNLANKIEIHGNLDPTRLENSIRALFHEVDSLRARFFMSNEVVKQRIVPSRYYDNWSLPIHYFDSKKDYEIEIDKCINERINYDVDISQDELLHYELFKITDNHWYLLEMCNHLVLDGWAHSLIYRYLVSNYNNSNIPPLGEMQDLINCEINYLAGNERLRDREYWHKYCIDLPNPVRLSPEDRPLTSLLRYRKTLSGPLNQQLRNTAVQLGLRLSSLLLTLFSAYLARMSGKNEFVVGLPVASRQDRKIRNIPGMTANALPLIIRLSEQTTLADLAKSINRQLRKHLIHQRYRYEDLARELNLGSKSQPLFYTTINIVSYDQDETFEGCQVFHKNIADGPAINFGVDIFDRNIDGRLEIGFNANGSVYQEDDLELHYNRFLLLLSRIIDTPEKPLLHLDLLTKIERARYTYLPQHMHHNGVTFNSAFNRQVCATPTAIAIECPAMVLSYSILDNMVNNLSNQLTNQGVTKGDIVAVLLPRNADLVITFIALLRIGAVYLPINDDLPMARIQYILGDAAPRILLYHPEMAQIAAPFVNNIQSIVYCRPSADNNSPFPTQTDINDNAYIIYTSGSTGLPKGVMVSHRGIANMGISLGKKYGVFPGDRILQFSSLSFDASISEFCIAILNGATLVMEEKGLLLPGETLASTLFKRNISHLTITPSLLAYHRSEDIPSNITLIFAGESATKKHLIKFSHCKKIYNGYGPTEATICATVNTQFGPNDMSLGEAIDNVRIYVLDARHNPVPSGAFGELYIAGCGVAKGYINQKKMTDERFLPDIINPQERMYASGDWVYIDANGRIFYQGRKDGQIKLHGLRIETGEIKNTLVEIEGVNDAAVLLRPNAKGDSVLTAYVSAADTLSPQWLKKELRHRLPDYMVPTCIQVVPTLPITLHGKLDTAHLPIINQNTPDQQKHQQVNAMLEIVCTIFSKVLSSSTITADSDFFEQGGHSLLAFRALRKIKDTFGTEISIADFFSSPTPSQLLDIIHQCPDNSSFDHILSLRPDGDLPPLFCIHPAGGIGWPYAALLKYLPENQPLYAIQSPVLQQPDYKPQSIDVIAEKYIRSIRSIQPHGAYFLLGWSFGGHIAHKIATQMQRMGEKVNFLAMLDNYPNPSSKFTPDDKLIISRLTRAVLGKNVAQVSNLNGELSKNFGLSQSDDMLLSMIINDFKNTYSLMKASNFDRYDGDLLFIRASEDNLRDSDQVPDNWRPYVTRKITVHEVTATHEEIMRSDTLKTYAPFLVEALRLSHKQQ